MLKKTATLIIIGAIMVAAFWQFQVFKSPSDKASRATKISAGAKPATKVITQAVVFTSNNRMFEAVGTGRAKYSADIYPAVSEQVMDVFFEAQQNVKKGDVLVQLDNREEKLALKLAGVMLRDSKTTLDRYEKVVKMGGVPQSKVDSARAIYESAQVALDQAKLALEERQIIAPFDGIVGIPNVDPGDRVDTDTFITGLDARDVLYVDFEVPEALAGALKGAQAIKQKIIATTPSYPAQIFEGLITAQESRVDENRRTLMARASILNIKDILRPGMSFTTKWDIPGKDYVTVPEISVQWGRDGSFIWVIRDNKAEKIKARVVARKSGRVLLDASVEDGELVVVEGLQRLRPHIEVQILNMSDSSSTSKGQTQ
jgi:membrane fusion protein (multidrug efflux system)